MKKLNNKGFGVVVLLLMLVIVGAIAGVGYYVYNSQKKTNTALDSAAKSQGEPQKAVKKTVSKVSNNNTMPNENNGYLTVKEWGVKIPLSSEDKGVYYEIATNIEQSKTDPTNITVYSTETDSIVGTSGVSCKGEYVALLLRLPSNDARWQPSQNVYDGKVSPIYENHATVGDYQYALATKKQYGPTCLALGSIGEYQLDQIAYQKFTDVVKIFSDDFKNIKTQ